MGEQILLVIALIAAAVIIHDNPARPGKGRFSLRNWFGLDLRHFRSFDGLLLLELQR